MTGASYHGQPVLKEPVWSWEIPCYLYTGGLAGASAGIAYLAGVRGDEVLARRAWAVAATGIGISPLLLMSDLGRPARFLNMFRMFKVTSPMSVGSWLLLCSGASTTVAAAGAWTPWLPSAARVARPAAAIFGLPLCTYTAALVANTAVPAWHESRRLLPFVFGSGAALSAGAAATIITPPGAAHPARRVAVGAAALELGLSELMVKRLGDLGEPYRRGRASRWRQLSRAAIVGGTSLMAARGASSRAAAIVAGTLLSTGALSARWSVVEAGRQSARDPKYVIGPQREAIERGDRTGAARSRARANHPHLPA